MVALTIVLAEFNLEIYCVSLYLVCMAVTVIKSVVTLTK
jgi:hypothetical protein